jgi:hypothetical protein
MKQHTKIDFSKHILETKDLGDIQVYTFKLPDSDYKHKVVFIVGEGVTTVTGDFGNWVFCREFHPRGTEYISRGYADEKLEINSVQKSSKFDTDRTVELIKQFEEEYLEELDEETKDWLEQLDNEASDEVEYTRIAYREQPRWVDYDEIPFGEIRHPWLDAVYDAFNAMIDYGTNL